MRLNRLLKYINITIALAVLVIALAVYWFAGRPLPQTSGTINAPVSQKVTVAFDALGEPHIDAANDARLEGKVEAYANASRWLNQYLLGNRL